MSLLSRKNPSQKRAGGVALSSNLSSQKEKEGKMTIAPAVCLNQFYANEK
jgi:hypothetical protein